MNTITLTYAVEIEKAGSISKAAANLYIAQPNLSKAMKDLEDELGYAIFIRTSTGVRVTEKGELFLYHAHKMLEQMAEIEKIAGHQSGIDGRMKISIPRGSYIAKGFTAFVSEMDMQDKMELTLQETNAIKTIENVADHDYNLGIIRYPVSEESFFLNCLKTNHLSYDIIWEFNYVLVMSKEHPLADKPEITLNDLKNYVQITHGDIDHPGERFARSLTKSNEAEGKVIFVYERGSQFDLLTKVPTTYMWVSPIPENTLTQTGLVTRVCHEAKDRYKDVLIYRDDYILSDNDILFQKKIYDAKVEVASQRIL